jgi:DNA-directed RNA polymerase subunit RPC12/RpoP
VSATRRSIERAVTTALACPQCAVPMAAQQLDAHYEQRVAVDVCTPCRLVWFDERESVRLSGLGWIELLSQLQYDAASLAAWAGKPLGCARCRKPLRSEANTTRYGRFVANRCAAGHGTLQSQAMLLAERGLVRAPTAVERAAAHAEQREWACLNCGATVSGDATACGYCKTPVLLYDVPRLADSLRPHAAYRDNVEAGRTDAWPCHACGQVLDPTHDAACRQCGHPVVALVATELRPVLARLSDEWREWRRTRHAVPGVRANAAADKPPTAAERSAALLMRSAWREHPRSRFTGLVVVALLVIVVWSRWWG